MWKIIKLFFRFKAAPSDLPAVLEKRIQKICSDEEMGIRFITLRRRSVNYFAISFCGIDTYWRFSFESLEID